MKEVVPSVYNQGKGQKSAILMEPLNISGPATKKSKVNLKVTVEEPVTVHTSVTTHEVPVTKESSLKASLLMDAAGAEKSFRKRNFADSSSSSSSLSSNSSSSTDQPNIPIGAPDTYTAPEVKEALVYVTTDK